MRNSKIRKRSFVSRLKVWKKHLDSEHHEGSHARTIIIIIYFYFAKG